MKEMELCVFGRFIGEKSPKHVMYLKTLKETELVCGLKMSWMLCTNSAKI